MGFVSAVVLEATAPAATSAAITVVAAAWTVLARLVVTLRDEPAFAATCVSTADLSLVSPTEPAGFLPEHRDHFAKLCLAFSDTDTFVSNVVVDHVDQPLCFPDNRASLLRQAG